VDLLTHAINEAAGEAVTAVNNWPVMNSAHEAYAVLLEEMDELWDHVKTNQKKRDLPAMKKEAIQVAAMALRFAAEVCTEETEETEERGRK
jgi:NTP pyrophosphatase (non-canonical NTP hydrolase)